MANIKVPKSYSDQYIYYTNIFNSKLHPWFESLKSGDQMEFLPPMTQETRDELYRIRAINEELQQQRIEEEERKAREAEEAIPEEPAAVQVKDQAEESDDDEIITPVKNTQPATKNTLFMPSKKEDADESLFTKYA